MKRLNVKLVLWLTGILLVTVVGVHFLHGFQLERNADSLKLLAETAVKQGNTEEAIENYDQYLKYKDDAESYAALGELVDEAAMAPGASNRDKRRAYAILEEAIRRHPDLTDVRERLIEYMLMMRRFDDGLGHIDYLKSNGKSSPKLELQRAKCQLGKRGQENQNAAIKTLNGIVGFDEQTGQFNDSPGEGGKEVEAFQLLAQLLYDNGNGVERSNAVMDQLVAYNPESAKAHLTRAQYIGTSYRQDAGSETIEQVKQRMKADLDKAYEIAPDDADVLLAMASFAMTQQDNAGAKAYLQTAQTNHPERQEAYVLLAQLALSEKRTEDGIEFLKTGLAKADNVHAILQALFTLQLNAQDFSAALATCDLMDEKELYQPEFVRFSRAKVRLAQQDFWEASRELEAVRPALARGNFSNMIPQLDLMLAACYKALALPDRQLEVTRRVVQLYPTQLNARLNEALALQSLGRYDEAVNDLELLFNNLEQHPEMRGQVLQLLIADQGRRPKEQRNWTAVNQVVESLYKDPSRGQMDNALLKAELLMAQDQLDEAQSVLLECRKHDPKDERVWSALTRLLVRTDREDRIGALLDQAEKEVGDAFTLRSERLRQIVRQGGDDSHERLKNLEQGLDKFSEPLQLQLMMQLGGAYFQIREMDDAKRCWKYVVEHDAKNAQIRQLLFELMVDTNDAAGMDGVLKELQGSPNWGPQSPLYKYAKAMSLIRPFSDAEKRDAMTDADRKSLTDARRLITEALSVRGEWGVLWRVRAEIEYIEGNVNGAIDSYQRALACSHSGQALVARRLVQLLSAERRFAEADEALKYVGELSSADPLNSVVRRSFVAKGDIAKALELAEKDVADDASNPASQIGLAQILEQAGRVDEAEAAYRKAVEVGPNLPQAWILLVRNLVANKKTPEATEAIRKATPLLVENPIALAKLHELAGDAREAERYYQAAIEADPSDIGAQRQMAEFYVRQARSGPRPDFLKQAQRANPYLQQMVDATNDKNDPQSRRELGWARRAQAEIIAATGVYEDVVRATQLVEKNAKDGKLLPEDIQAIVQMLSRRAEPESRAKSVQLIEQMAQQRPLTAREQLVLGQLYEIQGDWSRAKGLMATSLTQENNDPEAMLAFVKSLTKHEEYDEAERWLTTLDDLMSTVEPRIGNALKPSIYEARARVLAKTGQPEKAVAVLRQLVPSPLSPSELGRLAEVAMLLEQMGQYDDAQQMLEEYVSQEKRGTIAMAAFLGRRGQVDKAFELLDEARKNQSIGEVLPVALETLRYNPDQATPERFRMLEQWAQAALKVEGNVPRIKLLLAEINDVQGRYGDVVKLYREVLAAKETTPAQAALVKNNLAFILAVTKQDLPEALKLIDESINVMGPMSDLLDTRGLIYLNQGNLQQAMADLKLSASDSPTLSKYLHLALAEKQADNLDGAREALAQAEELGDNLSRLTPLERKSYLQLVDELK